MAVVRAGEVLRSRALIAAAIALACFLAWPAMAAAESFTVNTAADETDLTPGNELCETAAGKCALRAAIEESNELASLDAIFFEEESFEAGDPPISLSSGLPTITDQVGIFGRECETGAGVIGPCVEIDGPDNAAALTIANVTVTEGFVEVESLAIVDSEVGIEAEGVDFLRIRNSWFGVGVDGGPAGNQVGVRLGPGSEENQIGGVGSGTGNLFAHGTIGLDLLGASRVKVFGNKFGVSPTGTAAASNGTNIAIASTPGSAANGNTIGTRVSPEDAATAKCDGGCNLVSGSESNGIDLAGDGEKRLPALGTTIAGNQIGLDATGEASIPNAEAGILVGTASNTVIGGSRAGEANSLVGGTIAIESGPAPNLIIRKNLIGSGATANGTADPPENGVLIDFTGLSLPTQEALVLENEFGLDGGTGISQVGLGSTIAGNLIEGAATGIEVEEEGFENLIESNLVEATDVGVLIKGRSNKIVGNEVFGGEEAGIRVEGSGLFGVSGNSIGGDSATAENAIGGSGGPAIEVENAELSQTEIGRNHGSGNAGAFIDLVATGGEPEGPNEGILPPIIASTAPSGIAGFAEPNAVVRVFRKQTSSPGELESFLGAAVADGNGDWSLAFPAALPTGTFVAATQTNSFGGTSELAITDVAGFAEGAGQNPNSPPAAPQGDKRAPHTEILQQSKVSLEGSVRFFFASNERGSRFQCSLDKDKFRGCKSPKRYRGLKPGKHVFRVRAIDRAGNVDPTPAKRRFRVLG